MMINLECDANVWRGVCVNIAYLYNMPSRQDLSLQRSLLFHNLKCNYKMIHKPLPCYE